MDIWWLKGNSWFVSLCFHPLIFIHFYTQKSNTNFLAEVKVDVTIPQSSTKTIRGCQFMMYKNVENCDVTFNRFSIGSWLTVHPLTILSGGEARLLPHDGSVYFLVIKIK